MLAWSRGLPRRRSRRGAEKPARRGAERGAGILAVTLRRLEIRQGACAGKGAHRLNEALRARLVPIDILNRTVPSVRNEPCQGARMDTDTNNRARRVLRDFPCKEVGRFH